MTIRVLTGVTTTGIPHLGNYAGAIRPAIRASQQADVDAFFFMADYHALIKCDDPERVAVSRRAIAATWIACGLDVEKVTFYRQSDIPEIPELTWMLNCVTGKGLMNRAHAYKASVDKNELAGAEPDDGVTMGLFSYPVLMAADILMFNAHKVPVGRDQVQHLEMARDIAKSFNHLYGRGKDFFVLPEVQVEEDVALLPGLDGRKMSKSYDNTIPLFEGGRKALKSAIARIVTDSKGPGEAKNPDDSHLMALYQAFSTREQSQAFRQQLLDGLAWGEAKQALYDLLETMIAPMRERYEALMARPQDIEELLQVGARKARSYATPFIHELKAAVGLRDPLSTAGAKPEAKVRKARFVNFRDEDGSFRFRLMDADGQELFLSRSYADPKQAGAVIKALQGEAAADLLRVQDGRLTVQWQDQVVAELDAGAREAIEQALATFRDE
ncbi:tryptophan--tRNA ligase [Alcaligenes sp. WGS1538]|uniref:tryptophan--tRNA ligase n=1 Tax=Alcaligenes sp. WGS1538 TaxID=3366811 RepID=UPI00372D50C4